jgi:hypothetical protein
MKGVHCVNSKSKSYVEVWGDTVVLKELFLASLIGIALTMIGYSMGLRYFSGVENLDEGLVKGYSLMTGIIGCILAAVISAILFKPKRVEQEEIEKVIIAAGMTLEEEAEALESLDEESLEEMRQLELNNLLELRKGGK